MDGLRCLFATQFNCGGRSIKQGLIAVDIVSHCKPLLSKALLRLSLQWEDQSASCKVRMRRCCSPCRSVCAGTWAATLLQSSNVAYKNGVSGPFW